MNNDTVTVAHASIYSESMFPPSVSGQQPIEEPEEHIDFQKEEDSDPSLDIASLHIHQTETQQ